MDFVGAYGYLLSLPLSGRKGNEIVSGRLFGG